jgi:hypothetical protein
VTEDLMRLLSPPAVAQHRPSHSWRRDRTGIEIPFLGGVAELGGVGSTGARIRNDRWVPAWARWPQATHSGGQPGLVGLTSTTPSAAAPPGGVEVVRLTFTWGQATVTSSFIPAA